MMIKLCKISTLILAILLCCALPISASARGYEWYCIRQKAHRRPPIPSEFAFMEELDAYYIDKKHTEGSEDKVVYLTFDAGYENGNVAKTLDILRDNQVPAAFFVLAHLIRANGDLIERMTNEGHLVCNHTASHPNLSLASRDKIEAEIRTLESEYKELTGKEMPQYFRPPEGSFSRNLLQCASELGYKTVFWSLAYADWDNNKQPSRDTAMRTIMDNMHNGAVILLHPTSATNVAILPEVIKELRNQGYRFGTLDELCAR